MVARDIIGFVFDTGPKRAASSFLDLEMRTITPNKSPEPTAVGAGSSAVAVHVASRRWLSFLR